MKHLFTLLMILLSITSSAQKSEIINDSTQNKDELFSKSNLWVVNTWKSANDVIQMKDSEAGVIVIKGLLKTKVKISLGVQLDGNTESTITIKCKNGKVKIEFTNIKFIDKGRLWTFDTEPKWEQKYWKKWVTDVTTEQDNLINSLKSEIIKNDDF